MKLYSILAALLFTLLFLPMFAVGQNNQSAEWIRVQSDNGEFSIEFPAQHIFIADKTGFSVSENSNNYSLEEMRMFNAFQDKTLLSFECYKANKKALKAIGNEDDKNTGSASETKNADFTIRQFVKKNADSYTIRQYFNSKNYIYILTASSRVGETPTMKRFFDSLIFDPSASAKAGNNLIAGAILFSALKVSQIEIDEKPEPLKKPDDKNTPSPPSPDNILPLLLISKPRPAYTDAARMGGQIGTIQMRLTFSKDGGIVKAGFLKTLKYGLVRQAFFAALRIKFLPSEKDGEPQTVAKIVEYSFSLY